MQIIYDEEKRSIIKDGRGLDLARAGEVFEDFHLTRRDDKHSTKTEERFHSIGLLGEDVVLVTWSLRQSARRIVTMWKANEKERANYHRQRDRPG